jgi:hypothetical protein
LGEKSPKSVTDPTGKEPKMLYYQGKNQVEGIPRPEKSMSNFVRFFIKKRTKFDIDLGTKISQIHPKNTFFFEKGQRIGTKEGRITENWHHSILTIHPAI